MKAKDIRDLTETELQQKLNEARTELFNLRFQIATGQLDNPLKIRDVRRDIARIQTVLRERQLEVQRQAGR
jgi:large subunit ribosomal protein L29